jgi:hypothetical protein
VVLVVVLVVLVVVLVVLVAALVVPVEAVVPVAVVVPAVVPVVLVDRNVAKVVDVAARTNCSPSMHRVTPLAKLRFPLA